MSAQRSAKSHAGLWMLALASLPILYLLSFPPVFLMTVRAANPHGASSHPWIIPHWIEPHRDFYNWLMTQPIIGRPLWDYSEWWVERLL